MPSALNHDVLYALTVEVISSDRSSENRQTIISLSSICRALREICLPVLFAKVHWPHSTKQDAETGLHFFPSTLWPYIRHFKLIWPEDWVEGNTVCWGDVSPDDGTYSPQYIDNLVLALPHMAALTSFTVNCPFYPPRSIFEALTLCPTLTNLMVVDTPMNHDMIPRLGLAALKQLVLVQVGEAVRVGEGPYDPKYADLAFYVREWRRRYKHVGFLAAPSFLTRIGNSSMLRYLEVSVDLCALHVLADHLWSSLETLILTGQPPNATATPFTDVLDKMPKLNELRLLFAKSKDHQFRLLPRDAQEDDPRSHKESRLSCLRSLALSNACNLNNVIQCAAALERLAIVAIINLPRVPIALSHAGVDQLLNELSRSRASLLHLRIMIEDKVNLETCREISKHCPKLEVLEVEVCGYHDGKSIFAWSEFADAFAPLEQLHDLRICIQFPEFDEMAGEPWRVTRRECAAYLASRLPSLRRVGFEYRKRTGTHRYEDNWLDFDIGRKSGDGDTATKGRGSEVMLFELPQAWYPFPEVWRPVDVTR